MATATGRYGNLDRSFKLAVRSILTAFSREDVNKAFPSLTDVERERLYKMFIHVITSLHGNIEGDFQECCDETEVATSLDKVDQFVEEQNLDVLSTDKTSIGDIKERISKEKKDEIEHLKFLLEKPQHVHPNGAHRLPPHHHQPSSLQPVTMAATLSSSKHCSIVRAQHSPPRSILSASSPKKTAFHGVALVDRRWLRSGGARRRLVQVNAKTAGASKNIEVEVDKPLGLTLGQKSGGGVIITGVESGGNAARAGLKSGDQVLYTSSFFGDELWPADKLGFTKTAIQAKPDSVYFVVSRGGGNVDVKRLPKSAGRRGQRRLGLAGSCLIHRRLEQHTSALIVDTYTSYPSLLRSSLTSTAAPSAMRQRRDLPNTMRSLGSPSAVHCRLLR